MLLPRSCNRGFVFFPDSFNVSMPSDCEIQVTHDFAAPRRLVFDAFTKPELVRRRAHRCAI